MIPKNGTNQEWDSINQDIKDLEAQFASHLQVVKKELKCSTVVYRDIGKDIYQMEVPKGIKVPQSWIQISTTSVSIGMYVSSSVDWPIHVILESYSLLGQNRQGLG